METVRNAYLLKNNTPVDFPDLIAFWDFKEPGERFQTAQGADYTLQSQSGPLDLIEDSKAPLGGQALKIRKGQWLNLPRSECPRLDIHGPDGQLTVMAWIKRH